MLRKTLLAAVAATLASPGQAETVRISSEKASGDLGWTVLECKVEKASPSARFQLRSSEGKEMPVQAEAVDGGVRLTWLARGFAAGSPGTWTLEVLDGKEEKGPPRVEVRKQSANRTQVLVGGKEITALVHDPEGRKPYLYPVIGPNGRPITRAYPMETGVEGEKQDHPHQRSIWFTHGDVGGVDFWSESRSAGRVRQVAIDHAEGGPVFGRIVTRNEWLGPDGKKVLGDRRTCTIYPLENGEWLLDFTIELVATEAPVKFGDTKEGTFGIRLAETMKEARGGTGTIVSSTGASGMLKTWGKPAPWVDYHGKVGNDTVGVAILDHPSSFRHPTTWHVRDYGLFAANPFGYSLFYPGEKLDGSHKLERDGRMTFRYRVYFHRGTADDAAVERVYRGFASPPAVKVGG
jgi:hypothetical protein